MLKIWSFITESIKWITQDFVFPESEDWHELSFGDKVLVGFIHWCFFILYFFLWFIPTRIWRVIIRGSVCVWDGHDWEEKVFSFGVPLGMWSECKRCKLQKDIKGIRSF